ncbi:cell division DNA translocase FtsK/SpoIIIE family protein (plasmid) [Rhizobium phaseoli]|uniref:DNA translocase FtsK n=1 Tax=Rhizobium phaseoli TaxID=396 RepID=UPI0007E9BEFF|nr:DNA translocase FtsK [Rhizobium phaseoli]ANL68271.1 cell division DNA translocase FtsK/SpoIIIE family protein [Rhizobium phaseoli]ANL81082.1 cell division DNA translocase FtsK/SpoIIIE family protein [Rhizobium phaseoli]
MSSVSLQQIMAARFRTSAHADNQTKTLMEVLGLSTKAAVARLAIGRSLGLGALTDEQVDAKGLEIPASSLFTQDDVAIWVGLVLTHAKTFGNATTEGMDTFRSQLRQHWHRGAGLLYEDWKNSNEDFDNFVGTLVKRRADLPDRSITASAITRVMPEAAPADDQSAQLVRSLSEIGVNGEVKGFIHGPRVTQYKVTLRDVNQLDKLKRGLERLALSMNLQQQMPSWSAGDGARTVLIDIPRPRDTWRVAGKQALLEALSAVPSDGQNLTVSPGVDVVGKPIQFDLANAPHVLVGGATGQGKSVCVHSLLVSLITKHSPSTLRLALMDPKQVEFGVYSKSRFLWRDRMAIGAAECGTMLDDLNLEMDDRYRRIRELGVNNFAEATKKGMNVPFIVACVDELADLVTQDRDAEGQLVRLATMARAAGIHLILATQRPDAQTFRGQLRSNVTARIALTVQKSSESQIILDEPGAEDLLGRGDMIVKLSGADATRAHGYLLSLADVETLVRK